MKITPLAIPEVLLIEPAVFGDERGFFMEIFNAAKFAENTGLEITFVQDNHSKSTQGVLRGLHYQTAPKAQGKLVRVVLGEVFDVAVDIRPHSPTFGHSVSYVLSAENKRQLWIPEGFAHGFLTLSDEAEFLYKTTNYYAPECERSIRWNDSTLAIPWPIVSPTLSHKDAMAPFFEATARRGLEIS